ncbi:LPXTG cell wall anchor domain-containing protein [Aquihabitans sp. G128]|uniref:LPXTG cell wall anchor domain-containing protein n=1 Tax=Aquihabitans sp. G128 TaxID=2849779 RepID=UPI001C21077F|nr:LPXTG cell wall anchor domain-containing protein [Aquihabitans sp. G128]QXC61324.1 LPXTG cell wall anchor domain-containing protein [Aquihabitans sp. G128]
MIRKVLIGATMLVALFAAPAAAQYDPTVVNPGTVVQGGQVTVSGSGCQPNQEITITVYPESEEALAGNPTVAPVITVKTTSDENGNYSVSFTVPSTLAPGAYDVLGPCPPKGGVDVNANRAAPKLYYLGRFVVTAPTTPVTTPGTGGTGGTSLPRTGSNTSGMGLVGAGLLAAGGLLLLGTRKRRSSAPAAA